MTRLDDQRDQFAKRNAAAKQVNLAWLLLIERVNQALADEYDVLNPYVLSEAVWSLGEAQVAAGRIDFVDHCELLVRHYDAHRNAVDRQFPRRIDKARD
jgi:hypothetical protein